MKYSHLSKDLLALFIRIHAVRLHFHHGRAELGRERLGNLHRLADAGAFDDDVLDFLGPCQTGQLRQQVAAQGAADAAVLELDEFLLGLGDLVVRDEGSIDVESVASPSATRPID